MKVTPFTSFHIALGAKMTPFAGYNMPVSYSGINEEHQAVRNNAGVFDVSHMGEFIVKGDQALELIQRATTNDAGRLQKGQAQYSCMTNENAGIVDDLLVYCLDPGKAYMLVVNSSNIEKDWEWLEGLNSNGAELQNISDRTGLLAVQGPNATRILQALTELDIMNLKYYTFVRGKFAGVDNVLISATGYTGAGGVEIYFETSDAEGNDNGNAARVWNAIFETGASAGIKPIGLGARDTLRLEMGYCLYGNDIDDFTSPLEAGLGWITKFTKDFTARYYLEKQKQIGVDKRLVGFEMIDRGIPRHDYRIKDIEGNLIGRVTSGTQSPSLGKAIGMGYVAVPNDALDNEIYIDIRDKLMKARVVKLPFYRQ